MSFIKKIKQWYLDNLLSKGDVLEAPEFEHEPGSFEEELAQFIDSELDAQQGDQS